MSKDQETLPAETPRACVARICAAYDVTIATLRGRARSGWVVKARREAAKALRRLGLSYPEIGKMLGIDHTSAIYLVNSDGRKS